MANKLRFNEKYIEIVVDRGDSASVLLANQIPYVHSNRINTRFRTSIRNIFLVLKLFRGFDMTSGDIDALPAAIKKLMEMEIDRQIVTKTLIELGPDGETSNEHITLRRHQQLAVEIAEVNKKFAFFYDTRTGKTPLSLQIILNDIRRNPKHKWLVLCPLILVENAWLQDAHNLFPDLSVVNLHAKTKAQRIANFSKEANLYIHNIESFTTYREYIEKLNIHGCFVDESSTMKSNSSKFAKAAVDYARSIERWYLLSGSPAPNGEHEYFKQLQSVDMYGVHQSFNQFKVYFFNNVSHNPQYEKLQIRDDKKQEFLRLLRSYSLYVDKEDVLRTPGRDFSVVNLKLPSSLKESYKKLKEELYLELKDGVSIVSPSTAANLNKLNQVSSGFIIDTAALKHNRMVRHARKTNVAIPPGMDYIQEETTFLLSSYRFETLGSMLNSLGDEQVIVWCNFHKEFEEIKKMLCDECALVYGEIGIAEKNKAIADFKAGKLRYLIAHPASMGKGVTLTNAHIAIYFSLGYSYEHWKQSIERIYGDISSQPKRCKYYVFITDSTVDKAIYTAVKNKGSISTAVLNHLKGEA